MSTNPCPKPENAHSTEGLDCFCHPTYLLPCDDCDVGCWKCHGGTITLTREQAEQTWDAIIIVHKEGTDHGE